ncbi:hypothetical protein [Haloactinomyces albus]|uniref:Uncharacterized protein n=1 Tax=Haloactinomyces albus TaxID=1352928 RepID=A0AAE3Z9L6_9ACTN|nr:hypothetical protein [Haloactinomyces albus]MDR7300861.1 hypothetical protein [Haloactinomyces albus]
MVEIEYQATSVTPKTGREPLTSQVRNYGAHLADFWRWASSDLLSNTLRGTLAEYIVALALGGVDGRVRREWDAVDLITPEGIRVEVKSAAYLQTWVQERPSQITFGIAPTYGWYAETNSYSTERRRQADAYVFCLLHHTDKATVDPLNLDQWTFLVMATSKLNESVGDQSRIGLAGLRTHGAIEASFEDLYSTFHRALSSPLDNDPTRW